MEKQQKIIIPAAGYGRRVGQPEAKELLPRPKGSYLEGRPMIAMALRLAENLQLPAHIILREEKQTLIRWLEDYPYKNIKIQLTPPTQEWPETILMSKGFWAEENVMLLPDVDFKPHDIVGEIFKKLQSFDVAWATFQPENGELATWGAVDVLNDENSLGHAEKPHEWPPSAQAWGVFGFRSEAGQKLLEQMLKSTLDHQWRPVPGRYTTLEMTEFRDLTRS
jgi:hypothetical protein